MKASTILPVLPCLTLTLAATDAENKATCKHRFPVIADFIPMFCNKTDNAAGNHLSDTIMVPSDYATNGVEFIGAKMNPLAIKVTGTCSPPQWLPRAWCNAQFFDLCANTNDPRGWNTRQYGSGGCQTFLIEGRSDESVMFKFMNGLTREVVVYGKDGVPVRVSGDLKITGPSPTFIAEHP